MTLQSLHSTGIAALLLLSFHGSTSVAQPPPTFPDLPSQWTVDIDQMGNSIPDHILANTGVITLHGAPVFGISSIQNTGEPFDPDDMILEGGIRDNAGRWIYQRAEDPTEYLLYDFTGEVGDTVTVENPRWGMGPKSLVVLALEPMTVEVGTRFQWELAPVNGGTTEYWIEGIGSTLGLFGHAHPSDTAGTNEQLVCFHEEATLVYRLFSNGPCSLLNAVDDQKQSSTDLLIHPNPADGRILLTLPPSAVGMHTRVRLLDMTGRSKLDQEHSWSNSQILVDIGHLPPGPYLVLVEAQGRLSTRTILVVHR